MTVQGTPWPALLEDLRRKRDAITTMIDIASQHFVGDAPGEMPESPAPGRRPRSERRAQPRAGVVADSKYGAEILAALKKAGGVMKPGDLARALKMEPANLRYHLKPLEKSKQILVSGVTAGRRISLPGAKEAP